MGTLFLPIQPKSERKIVLLPDEDKLAVEITTPKGWKENDLTVVLVHGLCSSHKSPVLIRLTKKFSSKKIRVARVNLRGCGSGRGLAKSTYHCGRGDDIVEVLKVLKRENQNSPIILIGFSLGGNIILKMAGELKEEAKNYLKEVIALGPPVDLYSSVKLFEKPENKLYLKYFTKLLKEDVEFMQKTFDDFPNIELPDNMTLTDFNNLFIVPFFGFKDLDDYYHKASSKYVIEDIKIPCKILLSEDDPIVSAKSLDDLDLPDNVRVYRTKQGGHLGYIGSLKNKRGFYWLDSVLLDWILS
jgi:predicted alpha/beta-fold hydrolase